MKRFLIALVVLVLVIVGLGFYQGWWRVTSGTAESKSGISFSVDKNRIAEDAQKVKDKVQGLGHRDADKAPEPTDTVPEPTGDSK